MTVNIPSLQEMLKAGVHFGHRVSRWHPKMAPFIFGARNGVHVIDLEKTQNQIQKALTYVEDLVARGGTILFVGTKKQIQEFTKEEAKAAGVPHVTERWLGGTFTNFTEIQKLIKQYLDLQDKRDKGELRKYTKLEQLQFDRKIEELDVKIGGISTLTKLPEAIFVLDVRQEKTAVAEARNRGVKVVAICDTNVNADLVDYVIPANDDAMGSLEMITKLVSEAVRVGRARAKAPAPAPAAKAKTKPEVKEELVAEEKEKVDPAKEEVLELDQKLTEELAKEKEEAKK